jgi:hypothetical protein
MSLLLKTKKIPKEDRDGESHGISFMKQEGGANDAVATNKNRVTLRAELSSADKGIELMESEQKTDEPSLDTIEKKKDEMKDDMEKVSKNKVVILPESCGDSDLPMDEDMLAGLNKRK